MFPLKINQIYGKVPALRACHSHQRHPGVLEVPGIQELRQVPALPSHQQDPKDRAREAVLEQNVETDQEWGIMEVWAATGLVGVCVCIYVCMCVCVLLTAGPLGPGAPTSPSLPGAPWVAR